MEVDVFKNRHEIRHKIAERYNTTFEFISSIWMFYKGSGTTIGSFSKTDRDNLMKFIDLGYLELTKHTRNGKPNMIVMTNKGDEWFESIHAEIYKEIKQQ